MSKAKYISLIILSTLLYIAWLVGLYFSLGLFTHSTELNLPVYAASLVCAVGAWLIRRAPRVLLPLPAILANTAIVPFILYFVYRADGSLPFFFLTVFLGELLSAGVGGYLLATALRKYPQLTKYM